MALRPAAIIFVNADLTNNVKSMLQKQLFISETLDGYVFDDLISNDSNYIASVRTLDRRILVIRNLDDTTNRSLADVVVSFNHGLVAILENKFGPRGLTFPVVNLTWGKLCIF